MPGSAYKKKLFYSENKLTDLLIFLKISISKDDEDEDDDDDVWDLYLSCRPFSSLGLDALQGFGSSVYLRWWFDSVLANLKDFYGHLIRWDLDERDDSEVNKYTNKRGLFSSQDGNNAGKEKEEEEVVGSMQETI